MEDRTEHESVREWAIWLWNNEEFWMFVTAVCVGFTGIFIPLFWAFIYAGLMVFFVFTIYYNSHKEEIDELIEMYGAMGWPKK